MTTGTALMIIALAAGLGAGMIWLLHPLLVRYALARPNARSSHVVPTPQGGGIGVVAATVAATLIGAALIGGIDARTMTVFAAAVLLAVIGAVDDIITMRALPRLFVQFIAVGAVVSLLPAELRLTPLPMILERAVLTVLGVWAVNLTNFMDGIDWMTVAEVVPITAGLAVFGALGALPASAFVIALALLGAILGFAPYNRPVARLFLGDVGSLPIGLLLFWLLVLLAGRGYVIAALLLPLYYLADATITLARRARHGENVFEAHRSHFYQHATKAGWPVVSVIARVFAVNIGLVALALLSATIGTPLAQAIILIAGAAGVTWLLAWMRRSKPNLKGGTPG
ncbi:MAG: glycosyltransferase family 4 protein [Xanthobacteraceae bacterium]|nr:glycosyltransferase family 4 protein [Xanthobacteraceae bacterium]